MIPHKWARLRESALLDECGPEILSAAKDLWRTYGESPGNELKSHLIPLHSQQLMLYYCCVAYLLSSAMCARSSLVRKATIDGIRRTPERSLPSSALARHRRHGRSVPHG